MKRVLMLSLLAVLAFTVCKGGGEDAADEIVFVVNNGTEPESLDPAAVEGVPEHNIYMALFEGLVTYDPKTLAPVPGIAESWESSDDGLTWTFKLRENAVWSDGVKITAQTVVDSWLRFLAPETAAVYAYLPAMVIKGAGEYNSGDEGPEAVQISAIDDRTFQLELTGPAPYVLGMLTHYSFAVVPMHVVDEFGSTWTHPENFVGNGPFSLESWTPQDRLVVVKSDTYWDADAVQLDKVVFLPIEDENTSINMYQQGDIDWLKTVPDARLDEMKARDDFHVNASFITYYYEFNMTKPPFDDVRVRKALSMAISREDLVTRITRGGQVPAFGLTPPLASYPSVVAFEEDLEEARALLADAGYPNGDGFPTFTILYNTSEGHKRIAEYFQQTWADNLNIECQIENQEWATYLDNRQSQNFEIARAGWQGDYIDPNTFLTDLLHSESGNNDGKYSNPRYDALLEQAALLPDSPERYALLREAESIAIGEDMAIIPIYFYATENWIDTTKWGGWNTTILDVHPYKDIYKK